jgi:hypothetical protein
MYGRTAQGTPFRLPRNDPIPQALMGSSSLYARSPLGLFSCELGKHCGKPCLAPLSYLSRSTKDGREDGSRRVLQAPENRFDSGARLWCFWGRQVGRIAL